jgi:hypothetical protein
VKHIKHDLDKYALLHSKVYVLKYFRLRKKETKVVKKPKKHKKKNKKLGEVKSIQVR